MAIFRFLQDTRIEDRGLSFRAGDLFETTGDLVRKLGTGSVRRVSEDCWNPEHPESPLSPKEYKRRHGKAKAAK